MPTTCGNTSSLGITHEDDTKIGATITSTPEATTGAVITSTPEATTGASVSPSVAPTATPEEVATNAAIKVVTNVTGAAVKVISGTSVVTSGTAVTGTSVAGTFDSGKLENGTYIVEVSKNGFRTEKKEVIVAGKDQTVEINLVGTVASIESATEYILDKNNAADFKLALTYKDADGKVVAAPAGATVTFVDNKGVFNTDGTIKEAVKNGITADEVTVVATVKSDEVNLTKEFKVKVVKASDWKTVQEAKLQRTVKVGVENKAADASVAVVGDTISLVPTKATKYDGSVVSGSSVTVWENVKAVSSSDQTKLIANIKDGVVKLTPVSAGDATVTVALNSGETFTKVVTVKEEARKAKAATTDKALVEFSSAAEGNQEIKVTVKDQYGDALVGGKVKAKSVKETNPVAVETVEATTDNEGKATLTVVLPGTKVEGKDTFKIYESANEIGTFEVSYAKAGETATYGLELQNADATFDVNDKTNGPATLKFIARDKDGILSDSFTFKKDVEKNEVTVANTTEDASKKKEFKVVTAGAVDAVDLSVDKEDASKLIVTPKKTGDVTILVKEGEIVRAEYKITVKDTTPTVTNFDVKSGAKLGINKTNTLDNFKLSTVLDIKGSNNSALSFVANKTTKKFDVVDKNENVIAELELFTTGDADKLAIDDDGVTLNVGSAKWTENESVSLIVKLTEKANSKVSTKVVPVVIDDKKPTCTVATSGNTASKLTVVPSEVVTIAAITDGWHIAADGSYAVETEAAKPATEVKFSLTDNAGNEENFVATYASSKWTVITQDAADAAATLADAKAAAEAELSKYEATDYILDATALTGAKNALTAAKDEDDATAETVNEAIDTFKSAVGTIKTDAEYLTELKDAIVDETVSTEETCANAEGVKSYIKALPQYKEGITVTTTDNTDTAKCDITLSVSGSNAEAVTKTVTYYTV